MGVSRQTFGNILGGARGKLADCVLNGKLLRIEGGNTMVVDERKLPCCEGGRCRRRGPAQRGNPLKYGRGEKNMRFCIPVETYQGLESRVYGHFGSAPCFAMADTDSRSVEALENGNRHHDHGQCSPLAAIAGARLDALVTGGIGARALQILAGQGVKAYRAVGAGTVAEVLADLQGGRLQEIALDDACSHHGCH